MSGNYTCWIGLLCLFAAGCSAKAIGYGAVGAGLGAGGAYAYHKDTKEAVIGGLAGGLIGTAAGSIEQNIQNKKYKLGYEEGYNQAQVDIAIQEWDNNTGQCAYKKKKEYKHLTDFRVPEKKQDDVVYEAHTVTLEDYR